MIEYILFWMAQKVAGLVLCFSFVLLVLVVMGICFLFTKDKK